jgi:hypothetical protein
MPTWNEIFGLDVLGERPMGTVDQVMRDAKQPRLPGPLSSPQTGGLSGTPGAPPMPPPDPMASMSGAMFAEPQLPSMVPPPAPPPPPAGGETAIARSETPPQTGNGLPVQPPVSPAPVAAAAVQPQTVPPERAAFKQFRQQKRDMLTKMAGIMTERGSPAMRVQGMQLLFDVQKDYQDELAEDQKLAEKQMEKQRNMLAIEGSVADEDDKKRAATMLELGADDKALAQALRFNDAGAKERLERREKFVKWGGEVETSARDLGTIEVAADRALKLLDEGVMTTGTGGYLASWVPGSAHNQLKAALDPISSLTGYGYLQEMRRNSPTGGAVGNVTENETKWLMGIQGSLDPVNNTTDALRENIKTILRGKQIVLEMRKLAPAVDAGDPKAWDKYAKLTQELGKNGATVRSSMQPDMRMVEPEAGADFEERY